MINNAKNRERIERFRRPKALYNLKKNMDRSFNAQKEEEEEENNNNNKKNKNKHIQVQSIVYYKSE